MSSISTLRHFHQNPLKPDVFNTKVQAKLIREGSGRLSDHSVCHGPASTGVKSPCTIFYHPKLPGYPIRGLGIMWI